jgi:phosphoglucomutase
MSQVSEEMDFRSSLVHNSRYPSLSNSHSKMRFYFLIAASFYASSSRTMTEGAAAFVPQKTTAFHHKPSSTKLTAVAAAIREVPTKPIAGMKPGTSGLRKKVEVWQGVADPDTNRHYVENFIQSLLDTATAKNDGVMPQQIIVAGDGRYFNREAMQVICRVLAANGVANILVPLGTIMSTPAVSAAIRADAATRGGIVLTASHNPGGPGEDFGIKYNLAQGQPAGEDFTDAVSGGRVDGMLRVVSAIKDSH